MYKKKIHQRITETILSYFSYHFWFIFYALIEFLPYFFFRLYILVKKIKLNNNKNKGNDYVRRNGCCNTRDLSPKCQNSCYIQDKSHPTFIMIISFPLLSFNFSVPYSVGVCVCEIYTPIYIFLTYLVIISISTTVYLN